MILFEYGRKIEISPYSFVTHSPYIWKWVNPNIALASWIEDVYGIEYFTDPLNVYNFINAAINNVLLIKVNSLEDVEEGCFYWDGTNQIAYIGYVGNLNAVIDVYFISLVGASYDVPYEANGVLYPNILKTKPNIVRTIEPITIGKLAIQSISIELENDEVCTIIDNVPIFTHRFDDIENILGQETYVKYGEDTYEDLKILHKGVIVNYTITPLIVKLDIDDVRAKNDAEWPTYTYEDAGYTEDEVEDITRIIPDGFGSNNNIPITCINRDKVLLMKDEDDTIVLPDNLLSWDITTWSKSNAEVTKRTNEEVGGFETYRIAKTDAASYVYTTFSAEGSKKVTGYIRCDSFNIPVGMTYITIDSVCWLSLYMSTKTYSSEFVTNLRIKFSITDNGQILAYFSFETPVLSGTNTIKIYSDTHAGSTGTAIIVSGIRIDIVEYPKFRVSKLFTGTPLVYYEQDEELIELTNLLNVDEENGIIELHDVDAHENGILTDGLKKLFATVTLRPETNPFDIITFLNEELFGVPYNNTNYNTSLCEAEKLKLVDISMYEDAPISFSQLIEDIQNSSIINFRYDDVDKRYIMVDDPNRSIDLYIPKDRIINLYEQEIQGNMTLYADEVTINYAIDRSTSDTLKYRNTSYQYEVLARYRYKNPKTFDSYLSNEADAINKSIVLLEDLSVTRPIHTIKYYGLDILNYIDLLSIIIVDLTYNETRPMAGVIRAQVIGIDIDTEFDIVTLTVRERAYSDIVAGIIGSGYRLIGTATDRVLGSTIDRVIGHKED